MDRPNTLVAEPAPAADTELTAFGRRREDVPPPALHAANAARASVRTFRKLSVLVPLYNERWTIGPLLERVLSAPVPMELEVIVVDDGSTDGGAEVAAAVAASDPRVRLIRSANNQGKGAAVRLAIAEMSGDIAVVQDADLEYDPHELPRLLGPILSGHADAVFGSRFGGGERRALLFWHALGNRLLTTAANMLCDLNLSDMETCYKAVRADVLRELRLVSSGFDFEPELTCRLSQWGARIYETPISYRGRDRSQGKKAGIADGFRALARMAWCKLWDDRFTRHTGMYVLRSCDKAKRYNRWLVRQVAPFLGSRLLEAGAGIGNLSQMLTQRERLVLIDHDPLYVEMLHDRFQGRGNVRVMQSDLTEPGFEQTWQGEGLDTILCSNVLEHLEPHEQVLAGFARALRPGGHAILIVPAEPSLYSPADEALGHFRRYTRQGLEEAMQGAGFEIVHTRQVCRLGAAAWLVNGRVLRRSSLTPRQMLWFDRLWPVMQGADPLLPWPGMSLICVGRKP